MPLKVTTLKTKDHGGRRIYLNLNNLNYFKQLLGDHLTWPDPGCLQSVLRYQEYASRRTFSDNIKLHIT